MEQEEFDKLVKSMDKVSEYVLLYYDYLISKHNYGKEHLLTMVEVHTLALIAQEPGLLVGDVAKRWNRTRGAASKNINKLVQKGYVQKKKLPGNNKSIHLYPTESGLELVKLHEQVDYNNYREEIEYHLSHNSPEDLFHFFKVLDSFIRYMK